MPPNFGKKCGAYGILNGCVLILSTICVRNWYELKEKANKLGFFTLKNRIMYLTLDTVSLLKILCPNFLRSIDSVIYDERWHVSYNINVWTFLALKIFDGNPAIDGNLEWCWVSYYRGGRNKCTTTYLIWWKRWKTFFTPIFILVSLSNLKRVFA